MNNYIQQIEDKGYSFVENVDYLKYNTNIELINQDGYLVTTTFYRLIKENKNPVIFGFTNKHWEENVLLYVSKMQGNSRVLEVKQIVKDNRKRILITAICECGNKFNWIFNNDLHKTDKFMCSKCKKKITAKKQRKNFIKANDLCKSKGFKLLTIQDTYKNNHKVLIEDNSGYRGYTTLADIKNGKHFSVFSNNFNSDFLIYNANIYLKSNDINSKVISFSEHKYYRGGFKCLCECGNEFETTVYSLVGGKKTKCDKCSSRISKLEHLVKILLEKNNVQYIQEYRINDCRDLLPLPFDFYIDGKLIEVDGQQHFYPINFGKSKIDDCDKNFQILKKHDYIKDMYCKHNNIPLLRISYTDFNDNSYQNKILSFIKE